MEQFLSEENNLAATCAYMSRYVNLETVKASTFKILRNLVTNFLAKQFSFKRSGTKRAFQTLKLYSVVEGAFVSKEEKFNLTLVESATSVWLVNAAWRKQEDGSSRRSSNKSHRKSRSRSLSSNKSYTLEEELSLFSPKRKHKVKEKSNNKSSHCSLKDSQRSKGESNHRSFKECHKRKEKSE
ncbi:uncharacterized protein [Anoplolepis gracilipes]|uniref:uncharacterized protein n=1 Tax=Anoplolepis gracilipes TaxID=354296 RepID=UPI003BA35808